MAGGSFTTPTAPKGTDTALIPYSPQSPILQYLRFNTAINKTKDGYEYAQRNRKSPQRSYKMTYRVSGTDSYKLESLLFNPELFYLPLWEQKQVYMKKIAIGDTYINNYNTLSTNEMIFWLFKNNFEYNNGAWWVPDYLGLYGFITPDGVNDYVLPTSFIDLTTATTDEFSIAFSVDVSSSSGDLAEVINTTGGTTGIKHYLKTSTGSAAAGLQMGENLVYSLKSKAELIATAGSFVSIVYTQKKSTGYYKFYFDGVVDNGAILGGLPTLNFTDLLLFATTANSSLTGMKFKNFVFTNDVMDATDAANHASGNISAIDNKLAWYRCNDANTFATPYGDFNGTDNTIPTTVLGEDALSYTVRFRYSTTGSASYHGLCGCGENSTERNAILFYNFGVDIDKMILCLGSTNIFSTDAFVNDNIYRITVAISGSNYDISIYDGDESLIENLTGSYSGTLGDASYFNFGSRAGYGLTTYYFSGQIYEIGLNGKTWYFNPASSNTIKATDGTALTVQGTVTNFFVNDEPYTNDLTDSSGNGNHATPYFVYPVTFFNPNPDALLQGNRPNVEKSYLAGGSFLINQTDEVVALDTEFATAILDDYIKYQDIVRDYESKHFLFANNNNPKVKDVIGFSVARGAGTTPTLEQVLYYDADDPFTATGYDFEADQWVLIWESSSKYELLQVDSVSGNKITFKTAFTIAFDNPVIIPVFKALLLGTPSWQKSNGKEVFDVELDFMLLRNIEIADYTPAETHNSVMVMTGSNFYQERRFINSLNPEMIISDFGFGALEYYKNYNQSVNIKSWGIKAEGRTEINDMLKFLNYMSGQQREIYLPSLQPDFVPLANITAIQTVIEVENKGLTAIAASDGFNRAVMLYHNGDLYYADIVSITETSSTVEEVTIDAAFGVAVDLVNDNYMICWISKACLNSDQIDIEYKNGYAYAMLNFRETQA